MIESLPVELNDFNYNSTYDDLTTVPVVGDNPGQFQSVALNTANLIHDKTLNFKWTLNNLASALKKDKEMDGEKFSNFDCIFELNYGF